MSIALNPYVGKIKMAESVLVEIYRTSEKDGSYSSAVTITLT